VSRYATVPAIITNSVPAPATGILAPHDFERIMSLPGGCISHAGVGLSQLQMLRPAPGHARVRGLFFAGAGAFSGGGICARQVDTRLSLRCG